MATIMTDEAGLLFLNLLDSNTTEFQLYLCTNTSLSDIMGVGDLSLIDVAAGDSNVFTLPTTTVTLPTIAVVGNIPTITWADELFEFTDASPGTPNSVSSVAITATVDTVEYLLCVDHITNFVPATGAALTVKPVFQLGCGTPIPSMT